VRLPDLAELLELRALAQRLMLPTHRPSRAASVGQHLSVHRGRGLELQEVRAYVPGDDPRSIDWRVTARRGRPHTKLFREERERPVWLLVDLQPGTFFGTRCQLKSALIVRAAAVLAWTAALGGDRVGAIVSTGSAARVLAPRSREAGVLPLLGVLEQLQPRAPAPPAPQGLNEALRLLTPLARPGSLSLLVSDFAGIDAQTEPLWWALAARGEGRLFQVTDPLERHGLPDGRYRGGVPDALRLLDGASVRDDWHAAWARRAAHLSTLAALSPAPLVRLDTAQPLEEALALLQRRRSAA